MLKNAAKIPVLLDALLLPALGACGRDAAPAKPRQSAAQQAQQAIDAATAAERRYQDALARGDLAYLPECNAGSPEMIRLVEMSTDGAQGYSLAMTADARGAVAIWQGLLHGKDGKYQGYGPQGMRLPPSYSLFGKVVSGLEVVAAIDAIGSSSGTPKERVVIESVTITESEDR